MRDMRQGICPSCGHNQIVEATTSDFVGSTGPTRPLSVTHEIGWAGVKHLGVLKTCVCRRCGLVQWFAESPETIPIGPGHGTRLIEGSDSDGGPYR